MNLLSKQKDKDGYLRCTLYYYCSSNRKTLIVHRLVAYMFKKEDYKEDLVVNHINHIRDDNRIENLEWITKKRK